MTSSPESPSGILSDIGYPAMCATNLLGPGEGQDRRDIAWHCTAKGSPLRGDLAASQQDRLSRHGVRFGPAENDVFGNGIQRTEVLVIEKAIELPVSCQTQN